MDDNVLLRRLMRLELEAAGYGVAEAADGLEALERLEESAVALVISDNRMPRMDGLGLLAAIRTRWETLPVILVSAGLRVEQEHEARRLGVQAVFHKPVDRESLLEAVRHSLAPTSAAPLEHALSSVRQ